MQGRPRSGRHRLDHHSPEVFRRSPQVLQRCRQRPCRRPWSRQVSIHVVERRFQRVQPIVQPVELRLGNYDDTRRQERLGGPALRLECTLTV